MKVTFTKRYCYSQQHSWSGGFGKALSEVEELRQKYPESNIVVEYNERSQVRNYRVVRYTPVELELPDMPTKEEFNVPKKPRAKRLPMEDFEQTITAIKHALGYQRYTFTLTHKESGESAVAHIWYSSPDKVTIFRLKRILEERLDPTFQARHDLYRQNMVAHEEALQEWQTKSNQLIKERVLKAE